MGESAAVLLRSFSHPSDASRQGDPLSALTESVSFGRFVSDSLAWERWSTFSHNRYLEEVEKFFKPGSVAEKKAYFEAHFKRKAAMNASAVEEANAAATDFHELKTVSKVQVNPPTDTESADENSQIAIIELEECMTNTSINCAAMKAAAIVEANAVASDVPELKTTSEIQDNPTIDTAYADENSQITITEQLDLYTADTYSANPMDAETSNMIRHVITGEQLKNDSASDEVAPTKSRHSIFARGDMGDADGERGEAEILDPEKVENQILADNLEQHQKPDVQNEIEAPSLEIIPHKEAINPKNSASSRKARPACCSSKSSSESGVSRFTYPTKPVPPLPPAKSLNNIATTSEETIGHSKGKRRITQNSLHKSISFCPRAGETSKASLKKPKDNSITIQTPARVSVNGISKHLSKLFQSEDKRSKALVSKSVSGGTTEPRQLQSPSMYCLKSSRLNGGKIRPPCRSSPFSFRSEERVAKRKQFFEKLEEHNRARKAENAILETRSKGKALHNIRELRQSSGLDLHRRSHLQNSRTKKEKTDDDIKEQQQSTGFKALSTANSRHGPPSPTKQIKKKPLCYPGIPHLAGKTKATPTIVLRTSSRPPRKPSVNTENFKTCSVTSKPKFGRKPTANPVEYAHTRPPWRASVNVASFKLAADKNNGSTNRSVSSLAKKKAHENVSPNIQH